jgi:hypothetical protein
MSMPDEDEESAKNDLIKRLAFPDSYWKKPNDEIRDFEWYVRRYIVPFLCIGVGMVIQSVIHRPDYAPYPPRVVEGERVQRYRDSLYYMSTKIDSAVLDFGY